MYSPLPFQLKGLKVLNKLLKVKDLVLVEDKKFPPKSNKSGNTRFMLQNSLKGPVTLSDIKEKNILFLL